MIQRTEDARPERRAARLVVIVGIAALTVVAVVLVSLPYAVRWYAESWLEERGLVNVAIADVDINPFVGTVTIEALTFEDNGMARRVGHATVNLDWASLFQRRFRLSVVELKDASLEFRRTESNRWLLGTIVLGAQEAVERAEQTEASIGWGFGIDDLRFERVEVDYRDPAIARAFTIDSASLSNLATWEPDTPTRLDVALSSAKARLVTSGTLRPFADTFDLDLSVEGTRLDAAGLDALLAQLGIDVLRGELDVSVQVRVSAPPDSGPTINVEGSARLTDWALAGATLQLSLDDLEWAGRVVAEEPDGFLAVRVDGELHARALAGADREAGFKAAVDEVRWQGATALADATDGWQWEFGGELVATGLHAGALDREQTWLDVASMRTRVETNGLATTVSLRAVEILDLALLERHAADRADATHVARVGRIDIQGLTLGADAITVQPVKLTDLALWIERTEEGRMEVQGLIAGGDATTDTGDVTRNETASEEGPGIRFSLGGIETAGVNGLTYVDHSVRPVARLELAPLTFAVGAIDTDAPERDTPFELSASSGRYGRLEVRGEARPVSASTRVNANVTINGLDMIKLDGFARRAIGYSIEGGTLTADVSAALDAKRLDSLAQLTIRKLTVEPVDASAKDAFTGELGVPLGVALGLLEDDQDTIRLDVPLKGDVDDLSVGIGDAMRRVLQKGLVSAMQSAATAYFAPLWPALAASKLLEMASRLDLRPVAFQPGLAALAPDQRAYVDEVANLLMRQTKTNLSLCGRAVAADVDARFPTAAETLDETQLDALTALAELRLQSVKDRMIAAGIDGARLVGCRALADAADAGRPRVDFGT